MLVFSSKSLAPDPPFIFGDTFSLLSKWGLEQLRVIGPVPKGFIHLEKEVNAQLEKQRQRYRPKNVKQLADETGFTQREIQLLYRSFKENCPNGIVSAKRFQEIFSSFFYYGGTHVHWLTEDSKQPSVACVRADATAYAKLVFGTFDVDSNGEISFEEFVQSLSMLWRGSLDAKLRWIFGLYDRSNRGYISQSDITRVVSAVYDMMGQSTSPPTIDEDMQEHARTIFHKLDLDNDGKISLDDFMRCCRHDETICHSLGLFDTVLDAERRATSIRRGHTC